MGFWHTGYIEFHEPTGLGDYSAGPPRPVRYACEYCAQDFAELEALRRHRFEAHPLRQPVLLLRGRPVGEVPVQLMTPLLAADVVLEDTARCNLNGQAVAPASLGTRLATMRREFVELDLTNDGLSMRRVLDFRIAEESDLAGVEAAFARMADEHVLNIDAVSRFTKECRAFPSAMPYCDGICHYLYGVMAKERSPDSGLRSDQYSERYQRAADELAGFERVLPRSIRALVAFHFNHFHDAEGLASEGTLKNTAGAFAVLLEGMPWLLPAAHSAETGGAVEELLTDQDTLQILGDACRGLLHLKAHAEDLLSQVKRMSSGYDRLKRQLLAGEALAARGDDASRTEARKLARELVGQVAAGPWAEALLKRMKP